MSEEDLTNYKTYISDLDITKYVVLDNESDYWYSAEYVDKMFKKQDKEIERLNNIINEKKERQDIAIRLLHKLFGTDDYEINYIIGIINGQRQIKFDDEILDKVGSDKVG